MDERSAPTLDDTAAVVGAYRWAELRLFELTGAWAAGASSPAVCVHLFEMSPQHAWHAELWAERLPVLTGDDPERRTAARGTGMAALFDALGTLGGDQRDWLAGLYRVAVPRLLVTYRRHLARLVPAADGPLQRALLLTVRDEQEQLLAGEALLQDHLATPEDLRAATACAQRLEADLVEAGAGPGLFPRSQG